MTTRSGTKQNGEWSDHPTKTLISTAAFNNEFYSYSTSYDSTQTPRGYLTVNPAATSNAQVAPSIPMYDNPMI